MIQLVSSTAISQNADFFTEFERFRSSLGQTAVERQRETQSTMCRSARPIILHDSHMRFALRSGADAICEKPSGSEPMEYRWLEGDRSRHRSEGQHDLAAACASIAIIALREKVTATV